MTVPDPAQGEPAAAQRAVSRDGFEPRDFNLTETSERQLSAQLVKRKVKPTGTKPPDIKTNR